MKRIIFLLLILLFASCSKVPESQKEFETNMKLIQSGEPKNLEKALRYEWGNENFIVDENFEKSFNFYIKHFKKVEYKILNVNESNGKSTIKIHIKAPDLYAYTEELFARMMEKAFSEEQTTEEEAGQFFNDNYTEILNRKNLQYSEADLELVFIKVGDKWKFEEGNSDNVEFISILSGGLNKLEKE